MLSLFNFLNLRMIQQIVLLLVSVYVCQAQEKHPASPASARASGTVDYSAGPTVVIYKTKKNYDRLVPVTLNEEKTKIVSYPGINDISYNGELAYPIHL